MRLNRFSLYLIGCLLLIASCSPTKYVPDGDSLYTGATVTIKDRKASKQERNILKSNLTGSVRPLPNKKFLGLRLKLTFYNISGGDSAKRKKLFKWLRKKGEEPVLASSFNAEHNRKVLVSMLMNRGFFRPTVDVTTKTKAKKTQAYFDVQTGPQYKIRKTYFIGDSSATAEDIRKEAENTLLTEGQPYNLDLIKGERERIDKKLKEIGYFYFKPDYILVEVDSSVGDNKVDMFVRIKHNEMPPKAETIYHVRDVYIYPNYKLNSTTSDTTKRGAVFYKGFYVIDKTGSFKPSVFSQAMQFQPGDLYSRTDQDVSLNRLVSLGTFKFVKNRFEEADTSIPALDVFYYLTPYQKKSLRLEAGANTQNDSRVGSKVSLSWRNRNAFRGAELFQAKIYGGFELQYGGGDNKKPNTYQAGVETSVTFPRFIVPFATIPSSSSFMPRTVIKAGYTLETQSQPLRVHSVNAGFGYTWKEDIRKQHQLFPINVYYVRTDTLSGNANYDYSYNYSNLVFNGLIIGPSYEFTYNSQASSVRKNNFYFDGLADFSGGFIGLDKRSYYGQEPLKIAQSPYAQFMKFQTDFRYYNTLSDRNSWATRLLIGVGLPYGNSYQLPNVKQFFSGGSSSLRGFRSRMVGPGTFNENYLYGTNDYIEMLGDVKMEFSTELRGTLYNFLKGAIFFDAGNTWLYSPNPDFPGGEFTKDFYKQLAADAGLGLRLDFKIIMLRLDWGIPIRKPWLPENQRWVFNQIDFGDPDWRKNNIILNIAIGYPF